MGLFDVFKKKKPIKSSSGSKAVSVEKGATKDSKGSIKAEKSKAKSNGNDTASSFFDGNVVRSNKTKVIRETAQGHMTVNHNKSTTPSDSKVLKDESHGGNRRDITKEKSNIEKTVQEVHEAGPNDSKNTKPDEEKVLYAKSYEEGKRETIRISNRYIIEKGLQLDEEVEPFEMSFGCPIYNAKIFCHSLLIDKLGDLTKFIILSLFSKYSIDEIQDLTQMGDTTIKEELDYLIRGGLINEDQITLTELGKQYGCLLQIFNEYADGIEVIFNEYTNLFEKPQNYNYEMESHADHLLEGNVAFALTRNDNYSNSLDYAHKTMLKGIPFQKEVNDTLYTTVKIEKEVKRYKTLYIKDLSKAFLYSETQCLKLAIPYDRITCRLKYKEIDQYRERLSLIRDLKYEYPELLSDKAKRLIDMEDEEIMVEPLSKDVNLVTGDIEDVRIDLESTLNNESIFKVDRKDMQLKLSGDRCKGVYLEESKRERVFQVINYPVDLMEAYYDEE
ncbi:hypothetical protein [Butyrivibrio sp. WCD3002]|uniref:hypothetical protein n=1 Tax=Butyrivibrio sp. WCD3002 TaxID=1280676 RepID=UPI00041742F5|nr:hypothetical protein [Butyrivibrio sp. WCD3002]